MSTPQDSARSFVAAHHPTAVAAILGGGATSGLRTATSDLDIVVFLTDPPPPFRETAEHDGWPVELFAHTPETFESYVDREVALRRSPLLHMCAKGTLLFDHSGVGEWACSTARDRLAAGPPPLSPTELEDIRYRVTDLLDDLAGATDPDELLFIADRLLTSTAELVLSVRGKWLGNGKWLLRRLREADPAVCSALLSTYRTLVTTNAPEPFHRTNSDVLDTVGGRLLVGYRRPPV
ncbi:nucleotidyltransferase domain-containing protein [Allokutzneria sp. A3M-2-11 16]|uniref:nucleotidyltransferase domain-containing protein n=1 Tax=Allokutzneria sp. A3M-2-11 16 TaxID=2962043 RepID=UPI0020B6E55D|nr:nucleotidyltransferase domain-containing protein [Allokutzneria sp. A3M-2-11 16]MCP3803566.1 nucleotidyltransferase domain-containing protein [Allokutzneria sp. A3M-2-11 16]